jgi:Arc/MetJ-type ribon-helix-helix transcriptional regulator
VAAENYEFLNALVATGRAGSLAEAIDEAVEQFRRSENRRRLAKATAEYFDRLTPDELSEEQSLAESMSKAATGIDFDREP